MGQKDLPVSKAGEYAYYTCKLVRTYNLVTS